MVFRVRRLAALICAAATLAGCGDGVRNAVPTAPTLAVVPTPQPAPAPSGGYPPMTGPSRVFVYRDSPSPRVAAYTLTSRFVLYDDGRFALQYQLPIGEYRGTYTTSNRVVMFNWEGWSVAGPWGAEATLSGDVLSVRYNFIMQLTDFEDADYVLNP
jgi:hypothetical protein